MAVYIGIDPGASGSMCIITETSIEFYDFKKGGIPNYVKALQALDKNDTGFIYLEKVHSMTAQGVKSVFSFGQRFGELQGMLLTLGLDFNLVPPRTWQKQIGVEAKSGKEGIRKTVESYLNDTTVLYGPKGGLLDGRCDALGIALYGKQIKEK